MKKSFFLSFCLVILAIVSGSSQDTQLKEDESVDFYVIEQKPEFPGGETELLKYVANNTTYPNEAKNKGIQGKVFVRFIIDKEGYVTNVTVVKSVDPLLDNEAVRVIEALPKWTPGKQRGDFVKVSFVIPINFTLNKDKK